MPPTIKMGDLVRIVSSHDDPHYGDDVPIVAINEHGDGTKLYMLQQKKGSRKLGPYVREELVKLA